MTAHTSIRYTQDNTGIVLAPEAQVLSGLEEVLAAVQAATGVPYERHLHGGTNEGRSW